MALFADRSDAGRFLAQRLPVHLRGADAVVLGLPRGGVPVAFEVAMAFDWPLDVFIVRKLGVPGHEELAFGAIASGGARVLNDEVVVSLSLSDEEIEAATREEERELARRERLYRGGRPPPRIAGRTAILVDDGLATGSSMRVAVQALRAEAPARIVAAVPIAPPSTCEMLALEVDEMICGATPEPFRAVGAWYEDFSQTSDDEVRLLLDRAAQARAFPDRAPRSLT